MRSWLEGCRSHKACHQTIPGTTRRLPTRLIHVTNLPGRLGNTYVEAKLCRGSDLPVETLYTTLSHCWGKIPFLTLTKTTCTPARWFHRIPVADLSKVFQDATRVTLELGIPYIWIDSLCIIQDSDNSQDWKEEAPKMGSVYGQAACGIAATGFEKGRAELFRHSRVFSQFDLPCVGIDWGLAKLLPDIAKAQCGLFAITTRWSHDSIPLVEVDSSPLYKRGWTSRERYLSPRVIHFCANEIHWECEELAASETFPAGYPDGGGGRQWPGKCAEWQSYRGRQISLRRLPSLAADEAYTFWLTFVEHFSKGELSFPENKLPATAGIIQILGDINKEPDCCISGCWLRNMHRALLWSYRVPYRDDRV